MLWRVYFDLDMIANCLWCVNLRKKRIVLLSAKISNSFFQYLEQHYSAVLETIEADTEVPEEFLRNPSSWLEAGRMESFLHVVVRHAGDNVAEVGHASPSLRAWGVLDGVLRMMSNPQDLYMQPERILSYFVSPAPQIRNLRRDRDLISFEMPFSRIQFPLVSQFLVAALESLPIYMGRPQAQIRWVDRYVEVQWSENQVELFGADGAGQQYSPEFLQSLVSTLEKSQRELEEKNRELVHKNNQLVMVQKELKHKADKVTAADVDQLALQLASQVNNPLAFVSSHLLRLNDYLARAQQLVTILVGQDRMTPQVREAMKRMDWAYILAEYPKIVADANQEISHVRDIVKNLSAMAEVKGAGNVRNRQHQSPRDS